MNTPLLTEKQVAEYLNLTPRALQSWRVQGKGPRHVRISGACIRYRMEDVQAWVESRLCASTSDKGGE